MEKLSDRKNPLPCRRQRFAAFPLDSGSLRSVIALENVLLHQRPVGAEVGAEVQIQIIAQIQHLDHGVVVDGHAVFQDPLDGGHFLLTVGVDARLTVGLGRSSRSASMAKSQGL